MADSDTSTRSRLGAFGIAVADLDRSAEFYRGVFGMVDLMTFDLPHMREIVLGLPGSKDAAGLVLMQYTDGSDNSLNGHPLKLVLYVSDPEAVASTVADHGGRITMAPTRFPKLGDALVGFVEDPDGHLIELLEG
ncbi:lactoylglutathione lyase [soil metagenome]